MPNFEVSLQKLKQLIKPRDPQKAAEDEEGQVGNMSQQVAKATSKIYELYGGSDSPVHRRNAGLLDCTGHQEILSGPKDNQFSSDSDQKPEETRAAPRAKKE